MYFFQSGGVEAMKPSSFILQVLKYSLSHSRMSHGELEDPVLPGSCC